MSGLQGSAIVSGGASGLGRACVERLHSEGMAVLIADVNDDAGNELASSLGDRAAYRHTDITDADAAVDAARQAAELDPHGLRVSIGCAGIGRAERLLGKRGPHNAELFATVITVNLIGMLALLRASGSRDGRQRADRRGGAASTSAPRRRRRSRARSARSHTRRPRAGSSR